MNTEQIMPRLLKRQHPSSLLEVDDFSCIEYFQYEEQHKARALVTTSLFVVVLSGKKVIYTSDGELHLGAGNCFFAKKGTYIFSEILSSEHVCRNLIFFIDDKYLARFLKKHPPVLSPNQAIIGKSIFLISMTPLLKVSIESILPYFAHKSAHSKTLLSLKLEELLLLCSEADSDGNFITFMQEIFSQRKQDIIELMESHYHKPVTVNDLARLSGRSLSSFKRDFKELFREPPMRWIINRRLEHARKLLLSSNQNVTEVCFEVGFENISHFSQLFKKKFGCPPSQVNKNLRR